MRFSNETVAVRRKFIEDFFRARPEATNAMAGAAIKQATGIAMAPAMIDKLRAATLGAAPIVKALVSTPVEAHVERVDVTQLMLKIKTQEEEIRQLKHELTVLSKARISQRGSITIIDVPASTPDVVARAVGKVLTDS